MVFISQVINMRTITIDELTKCLTELNISNEDTTKILNKLNEKKKPVVAEAPKIPIPFCGHIEKSWCCGVRKNHRCIHSALRRRCQEKITVRSVRNRRKIERTVSQSLAQ